MCLTECEFDELLLRARDGDRSAQGRLFEVFRGYLKLLAEQQLDSRLESRIDASDVIQQTCLTGLESFKEFRGNHQGEFVVWLRVVHTHVMQNLARHHLRAKKRSISREYQVTGSQLAALDGALALSSPSQRMIAGETSVQLARAMERLPVDQREAVRLRYCEALPIAQIAEQMGRSLPSVAGLLKRGLESLRELLARKV